MFWVISVYFNVRNILPKSGTFPPGHLVYKFSIHYPNNIILYRQSLGASSDRITLYNNQSCVSECGIWCTVWVLTTLHTVLYVMSVWTEIVNPFDWTLWYVKSFYAWRSVRPSAAVSWPHFCGVSVQSYCLGCPRSIVRAFISVILVQVYVILSLTCRCYILPGMWSVRAVPCTDYIPSASPRPCKAKDIPSYLNYTVAPSHVHAMKACKESGCVAPLTLNIATGWKSVVNSFSDSVTSGTHWVGPRAGVDV